MELTSGEGPLSVYGSSQLYDTLVLERNLQTKGSSSPDSELEDEGDYDL